jgi:hypothetical protein
MKRNLHLLFLAVISITAISCISINEGFDDLIHIDTINTNTHGEDAAFQKYFGYYINRMADDNLIAISSEARTARYSMTITVLESTREKGGQRIYRNTQDGSEKSRSVDFYGYKIKIDLNDNKDRSLVWTWQPDRWKTYSSPEKSIKWLAKYSAKRMVKTGLFGSQYLR